MKASPRAHLLTGGLAAALAAGVVAATPTVTTADPNDYTVIATGLNNPRHLSFTGNGDLFVAESGTGGDGPCLVNGEGTWVCYGATGSITELARTGAGWQQSRVVTGLPSLAPPADVPPSQDGPGVAKGSNAAGPSDVEVHRSTFVASIGLGTDPANRGEGMVTEADGTTPATLPAGLGTLVQGAMNGVRGSGRWWVLADIADQEARTNPVDDPDSNPASVLREGSNYVVADAGGNTLVSADRRGRTTTLAAFPDVMVQNPFAPPGTLMPMQFVPTSAVRGPDGAYYVSQLTGFPFPAGGSSIWRVDRRHAPTQYATGLTNVTDLAFASDGTLYAVEISEGGLAASGPLGALVRIPAGGGSAEPVVQGLFAPYGVALRGGSAYVTVGSVAAGGGAVIEVPLD